MEQYYKQYARDQARILAEAYGLNPAQLKELEHEFLSLVPAELKIQPAISVAAKQTSSNWEKAIEKYGADWQPTKEQQDALDGPLNDVTAQEPMAPDNLQKRAERRASPDRIEKGRALVPELQQREAQRRGTEGVDSTLAAVQAEANLRHQREQHRLADGEISPAGNPMPKAEFVPPAPPPSAVKVQPAVVTPPAPPPPKARPVLPETPRQEPAARVEPPIPPPPPLQPAPPVDEWDRHVDAVAQKYKFSSDQKSKGQGILKDLRDRARQYRKSHSADFEAASRMQPGADRVAEEKRLSQPLDELFAELKERLEHLPTQEQRDAAGVKPKK